MKIFISADIEGVNGIVNWDETELGNPEYERFRVEMTKEVAAACIGATEVDKNVEIMVKDAHDSARNIIHELLPENVKLHRGWQGCICSMMASLDSSYDAVLFVGYHSPARSGGNSLSHTMSTSIEHVKINGEHASEFTINAYYAAYLGVPVAFLSGDENLCNLVKKANSNIETVASKQGVRGSVISKHPNITHKEITEGVKNALSKDLKNNILTLPRSFDIEIQYKNHITAYNKSFYPGCELIGDDKIRFVTNDYKEALTMMKFCL